MHVLAINGAVEKYPYSIGQLRKDNPGTSFPRNPSDETLAEWNVYPVASTDRPAHDEIAQNAEEVQPKLVKGKWVQAWEIQPATADQIEERLQARRDQINAERDRRLNAPFAFAGKLFDRDPTSVARINGASTLAGFALGAGAAPGDLRWHGGEADFVWIAADNSLVPMDAPTTFAFGREAASVESRLIFAAKQLREMDPPPADFAADKWWP
jgi:hypothetical protein